MPLELSESMTTSTSLTGRSILDAVPLTWNSSSPAEILFTSAASFVPKPAPKPAPRLTNQVIISCLRELKSLREERVRVAQSFLRKLSEQSQNLKIIPRYYVTEAAYKAAKIERQLTGPLRNYLRKFDALQAIPADPLYVKLTNDRRSRAPYSAEHMAPLNQQVFREALQEHAKTCGIRQEGLQRFNELTNKLNLYTCPLTGEYLLARKGAYSRGYQGPLEKLVDAGACQGPDGKWYRSQAEKAAALKVREVLLIRNGHIQRQDVPEAEIRAGTLRKMGDGRDVLILPNVNGIAEYHSGIEDTSYDDSPRHVGIEIEVNAGSHGQEERERIAAEILLATSGRMKIERDGSVTGFELITGHGKPSSVRQELAAVFRQKLLAGFRTARSTGAHVHVTAPNGENVKVVQAQGYYKGLLPFYRDLGERPNTHHCRAGMHRGRYSEINVETGRGTVEFRLFKSQLKLAKLIRNAQFAWAYMELLGQYVPDSSEEDVRARFLEGLADLPREETVELRAWMAARGHKVPHVATDLRRLYRGLGVTAAMG